MLFGASVMVFGGVARFVIRRVHGGDQTTASPAGTLKTDAGAHRPAETPDQVILR
jgi:hypothetical protein